MNSNWRLSNIFVSFRIHDRKLCVLGLCTLISLGDAKPQVLSEVASKIVPSLILLFDGLKRAYESRAQEEEEEEEEEDGDDCEGKNENRQKLILGKTNLSIVAYRGPFKR